MTEQIKAWAIVSGNGQLFGFYYDYDSALMEKNELEAYEKYSGNRIFEIVELTSTPKIKMTQAEFGELDRLRVEMFVSSLSSALDEIRNSKTNPLHKRLFSNDTWSLDQKAQTEFAQLWASDNPAELVDIVEKRYYLSSKLDNKLFVVTMTDGTLSLRDNERAKFSQEIIDRFGGDDWLAEMGLAKVEVTE